MKRCVYVLAFLLVFGLLVSVGGMMSFAADVPGETPAEGPAQDASEIVLPFTLDLTQPMAAEKNGQQYTLYPATMILDMDGNGKTQSSDARQLLRIAARLETTDRPIAEVDVTGDGKLNTSDARLVLRVASKVDKVFYLDANMARPATGMVTVAGALMYLQDSGVAQTGWVRMDDGAYYFGADGRAAMGLVDLDGARYIFNNGIMMLGWAGIGGNWYYCGQDGKVVVNQSMNIEGRRYTFDAQGVSLDGLEGKPLSYKIAMLGDSLVEGMDAYSPTDKIDFYGIIGLHTDQLFTKSCTRSDRIIIDEVVGRGYNKVILCMGMNDVDYNDSWFIEKYTNALRALKERCPDADIYAHSLMPVHEGRANANGYPITNADVRRRSEMIRQIAAQEGVYFLDTTTDFGIENGGLPYDAASDGVHFGYDWCVKWADWLLAHVCA